MVMMRRAARVAVEVRRGIPSVPMTVVDGRRRDETAADRGRNSPFQSDRIELLSHNTRLGRGDDTRAKKNGKESYMDYIVLVLSCPDTTLSVGVLGMKN
jgi:hypothetical protein